MPPQVVHVKNASKIAAALANEKCQRILDYLGKHADATESKLSQELSMPLSTVHYNMKVLSEANLVTGDEYTYSAKGKEVTHYKLNKNPIVIVQEDRPLDFLKAITPAALLAAGIGIAYKLAHKTPAAADMFYAAQSNNIMVEEGAPEAARMMVEDSAAAGTQMMMKAAEPVAQAAEPSMLPYFIAGVVTTFILSVVLLFVYRWWARRLPK